MKDEFTMDLDGKELKKKKIEEKSFEQAIKDYEEQSVIQRGDCGQ